MGIFLIGMILSLHLLLMITLLFRDGWDGVLDLLGLCAASFNIIAIGALMWRGLLA